MHGPCRFVAFRNNRWVLACHRGFRLSTAIVHVVEVWQECRLLFQIETAHVPDMPHFSSGGVQAPGSSRIVQDRAGGSRILRGSWEGGGGGRRGSGGIYGPPPH